jgi:hypothetical protein
MVPTYRIFILFLLSAVMVPSGFGVDAAKSSPAKKAKAARAPRYHSVALGGLRKVPYSREGDPEGAMSDETELEVRPLVIDGRVKDWTTGAHHDVTEQTFTVRSAVRINDSLPADQGKDTAEHWVWQRGPWLLVDRSSGHAEVLKLPDFRSGVSEIAWFRDYAAYCGLASSGKHLYAIVAQLAVRKPLFARKLEPWDEAATHPQAACAPALWQREPLQVTFQPTGQQPSVFSLMAAPPEPAQAATPAIPAASNPDGSR